MSDNSDFERDPDANTNDEGRADLCTNIRETAQEYVEQFGVNEWIAWACSCLTTVEGFLREGDESAETCAASLAFVRDSLLHGLDLHKVRVVEREEFNDSMKKG
jgi:hypothetical protein